MKKFRTNFTIKVITVYLALNIVFPLAGIQTGIQHSYALTGGPSQPEFNSFTPIGTSDMVDLASGDFNYNIPIMDVGGYPLNLSYNSGITMDQEASWVGLGWNLNVGQINRNVRGLPDDFDGDLIHTEDRKKDNITTGTSVGVRIAFAGWDALNLNVGLGFYKNNYTGFYAKPSLGVSFDLNKTKTSSLGIDISSTTTGGPIIGTDFQYKKGGYSGSIGYSYGSREATEAFSLKTSYDPAKTKSNNKIGFSIGNSNISLSNYRSFPSTKRIAMKSVDNIYSGSLGLELFGAEVNLHVMGSQSTQKVANIFSSYKAFGYENTYNNTSWINGMLDFNREKENAAISKYTTILPITNYTYDIYSINGQGIGGMFKPFKSQVGYVYDQTVKDEGVGNTIGLEVGVAATMHIGVDYTKTKSNGKSSGWIDNNFALEKFNKATNNTIDYQETYFKLIGDLSVDSDTFDGENMLDSSLGKYQPIKIGIGGGKYSRHLRKKYRVKEANNPNGGISTYANLPINNIIKRRNRDLNNQSIQKITRNEATKYKLKDKFVFFNYNNNTIAHHTAGYKVLKNDGATYYYGMAVYNTKKVGKTFDVSSRTQAGDDCINGTITYDSSLITNNFSPTSDQYVNKRTTPAYAYTYLLTSVLSSDYEDVNDNGPDDNDLGSYTKFNYAVQSYKYNWRVPFKSNKAMYDEGLKSSLRDQKANYIYGEKQMQYINNIETKTHIAIFDLEDRKDALGVVDENGSSFGASSKKIKTIKLYSKPEYKKLGNNAVPIKTAHFEYNYSLCGNVDNNRGELSNNLETEPNYNGVNANAKKGKLTLTKVYFTYAKSKMGKYTPYTFNYAKNLTTLNPNYHSKDHDIWGNYKSNNGGCTVDDLPSNIEFPYVEQNKTTADENAQMWTLTSINLPSGGRIDLELESDDYQYVQNKKAMQMFKILGFGDGSSANYENIIYEGKTHRKYVYVETKNIVNSEDDFRNNYLKGIENKPIYFKASLNMSSKSHQYDFVSGYLHIDNSLNVLTYGTNVVAIPLNFLGNEGGWVTGDHDVNPIAKAGWYFGRTNLNGIVYRDGVDFVSNDFESVIGEIKNSIAEFKNVFTNANQVLENKGCARIIKSNKSWIRLLNPNNRKYGGGARVKKLEMFDNWDSMTNNTGDALYKQKYGQEYTYDLDDGTSSGVATFEPNASKENPFVVPFYNNDPSKRDRLAAPREFNYIEKPIGESFFPNARITYSKVTVKNLERVEYGQPDVITKHVKKHATGKVINEFFTSKDYPTITDYTDVVPEGEKEPYYDTPSDLGKFLNIKVRYNLTLSQGFVIRTNDMNGKTKKQSVYAEGNDESAISSVEYKYSVAETKLPTIDFHGNIKSATIGEHYDVVNDFKQVYNKSNVFGGAFNLAYTQYAVYPLTLLSIIPTYATHRDKVSIATTTKVIHSSGILVEKIAMDIGARVSTKNLAWDSVTGQVLVTETKNEYNDAYYTINYPAHWKYKQMGLASKNINLSGVLTPTATSYFTLNNAKDYLLEGDELYLEYLDANNEDAVEKFWVSKVNNNNVTLMDKYGKVVNESNTTLSSAFSIPDVAKFKVMRSGYRNLQSASMASTTSMTNPIYTDATETTLKQKLTVQNVKIVNTSAIEYTDLWSPQCECLGLPNFAYSFNANGDLVDPNGNIYTNTNPLGNTFAAIKGNPLNHFNPYLYNVKGNYKAVKSYAFLAGRNSNINDTSPRDDGFFTEFEPYYITTGSGNNTHWIKNPTTLQSNSKWTFASQVSKYSPYGVELENKDALNRYSSAQYGFNYTLPTAVSSNSKYTDMGYDSFEDYQSNKDCTTTHFAYRKALSNAIGNAEITNKESHTGHNAIKVKGGTSATLEKRIENCN